MADHAGNDGLFIDIKASVNDAIAALKKFDSTFDSTFKGLHVEIDDSGIEALGSELDQFGRQARNAFDHLMASAEKSVKPLTNVQKLLDQIKSGSLGFSIKGIGDGIKNAADSYVNAVKGIFDRVKVYAAAAGAVSITAALKSTFDVGGGFEASMTKVQVISGATAEQFELLNAKAREMGATLPITARDAADAMIAMAQRGTSAKDILASVTDVTNLAISQSMDLAEAANLLGSTMSSFGIAIEDAARVTDVFNNASNQSALTMPKVIEAMRLVAPVASAAGYSLEQTVAAMEALGNTNIDGSTIGTGLSGIVSKIAKSTEILGVQTRDAQGNLRALADIFADLKNKGADLPDLMSAFGERNGRMAVSLVQAAESLNSFEQGLRSLGSTQSAVEKQMDTWVNTMASLESAIEGVKLTVFDQLKEKAKGTVNSLTELTRAFLDWLKQTDAASKTLETFLQGFGVGLPSLETFKNLLASFNLSSFLEKIKNFGIVIRQVFETLKTYILIVSNVFKSVFAIFGSSVGTIGSFAQTLLKVSYAAKIVGGTLSGAGGLVTGLFDVVKYTKSGIGVLSKFGTELITSGASIKGVDSLLGKLVNALGGVSTKAQTAWAALAGGAAVAAVGASISFLISKWQEYCDAMAEARKAHEQEMQSIANLVPVEKSAQAIEELRKKLSTGFEVKDWELSGVVDSKMLESFKSHIKALQNATFDKLTKSAQEFNLAIHNADNTLKITDATIEKYRYNLENYFAGDSNAFDKLPKQLQLALKLMEASTQEAHDAVVAELRGMTTEGLKAISDLSAQAKSEKIKIDLELDTEIRGRLQKDLEYILNNTEFLINEAYKATGDKERSIDINIDKARERIVELGANIDQVMGYTEGTVQSVINTMLKEYAESGKEVAQVLSKTVDSAGLAETFRKRVSDPLSKILSNVAKKIDEAFEYTGDYEFSVNANLEPAKKQLSDLIAKVAEETGQAEAVIQRYVGDSLLKAAQAGGKIAGRISESLGRFDVSSLNDRLDAILSDFRNGVNRDLELGGDYEISIKARTEDATQAIKALAGVMANELGMSETAVQDGLARMFAQMANTGNSAAKQLANALKPPEAEVTKLTDKFHDFVTYLKASPSKFLPALKNMLSSVQAIDPATGKVTEAFKKAYSAVKDFANMSLDKIKSQIEALSSAVKKGFLKADALKDPLKNFKAEAWANMQINFDWDAFGGRESQQAMAVFISQFQDTLASVDNATASELQKRFNELVKHFHGNIDSAALSLFKDLDTEMSKIVPNLEIQQKLEPDMSQVNSAIAQLTQAQTTVTQQTQASASQITNTGEALVTAMSGLQNAIEANTAAKANAGSGNMVVDTSRLENICGAIGTTITGLQTDVQNHTGLLGAIQSAIATLTMTTTNNYNYDVDINQSDFTVQSKSDATSLANQTLNAFIQGLSTANA